MVSKDLRRVSDDVSFLVNLSIASTKLKKLVAIEKDGKQYELATSLHLVITAPIGTGKSTVLSEVSDIMNMKIITDFTVPGIIGTIDKQTMQPIYGAAWECRNSVMLLDEFNFKSQELGGLGLNVFLQLLEKGQRWSKRIAIFSAEQKTEDGDLYFHSSSGKIDIKTRFAAIITSMRGVEFYNSQRFRAFMSRCVPYYMGLSKEDQVDIVSGTPIFKYKEINPPSEVVLSYRQYKMIVRMVSKMLDELHSSELQGELLGRCVGDACRVYAITGNMKDAKRVVRYKMIGQSLIGIKTRHYPYVKESIGTTDGTTRRTL